MLVHPQGSGWIEVICGPMFSGKTEELIRRLRRAHYARQKAEVFKPHIDRRFSETEVVSHSAQRAEATPVQSSREILERLDSATEVVALDEAQFFTSDVVEVAESLANRGVRVIAAGLDTDYRGEPFEPVPSLMARAEYVTKLLAICVRCGRPANRSLRVSLSEARIEVGAAERYEAVCRTCHAEGGRRPMQPGSS
ncbi:MAG: thymidine kinase [Myxococcota bacterium]